MKTYALSYSYIPVSKIPVTSKCMGRGTKLPVARLMVVPEMVAMTTVSPGYAFSRAASSFPRTTPRWRPSELAKRKSPCTACCRMLVTSTVPGACGSMPATKAPSM